MNFIIMYFIFYLYFPFGILHIPNRYHVFSSQ